MTRYGIVHLSRAAAIDAAFNGGQVFLLDLEDFERVYEVRYMIINDIMDLESRHNVIYFEVVPDEN